MARMTRMQRGTSNEHRTINYLAKLGWVAVRAGASKGMGDCDVLAYHTETGQVKHVQSKSNKGYTQQDLDLLRMLRKTITAQNVSIELWDWYNGRHHPLVTVLAMERANDIEKIFDPLLCKILGREPDGI